MLAALVLAALSAQAEPAPPPPAPPPVPEPAPPAPANGLVVLGQFAYRLGSEGESLGPAAGFSLGGSLEHRYLTLQGSFELGAAIDFFYDRFATSVVGSGMVEPGVEAPFDGTRILSETSFALMPWAAWRAGPVRPFVGVGAGVTIGYFSSPEIDLRPGTKDVVQPLARGVAGIDVAVSATTAVVLRVDYTHTFTRPIYTTNQAVPYSLFGDLLHLGAGLRVRF